MSLQRDVTVTSSPSSPVMETTPVDPRWRRYDRYAAILVTTVVVSLIVVTLGGEGTEAGSGRLGGDYPAFYGAGSIVLDGDIAQLYDLDRQVAAQEGLLGDGDVLFFAYPPPVAAAYAPLAALPFRASYLVHSLLMLGALGLALGLLAPLVPSIRRYPGISLALALGCYPMLRAVTGGQNTALTVLLVVLALRFDRDGHPVLAGLAVAALLYKPQFGLPIAVLLLVPPRWAILKGWLAGATGFYAIGAVLAGPGWVVSWWSEATRFAEINEGVNGFLFISLPGMVANLFGTGSTGGQALWVVALVVALVATVVVWRRTNAGALRWALGAAMVVLVLPQALYYEAGLLVPVFALAGVGAPIMVATGILSWTQVGADALGWSPLGVIMPAALAWIAWRVARQEPARP